jgi:hypothetical protein
MRRLAVFLFLALGGMAASAAATEISGGATTLPLFYPDAIRGEQEFFAPLYEYLDFNAADIEDTGLSIHASGWGRYDMGANPVPGGRSVGDADLTTGYLAGRWWEDRVRVALGRHFVHQGVTADTVDGLDLSFETPWGVGVSGFGGVPVYSNLGDRAGDAAFGGRAFYHYRTFFELGASYGQFQERGRMDRQNVGGDLYVSPVPYVDLTGHASWDMMYQDFYDVSGVLGVTPIRDLKVLFHYDRKMPSAFFGKTSIFSVFSWDQYQDLGAQATCLLLGKVYLDASYSRLLYDVGEDAHAWGGGVTYYYGGFLDDGVGVSYRRLDGDDANSYHQVRGFWFHLFLDQLTASADLVGQFYDVTRSGVGESYQATGSVGWKATEYLELLGSLDYARTPDYDGELRGLLRVAYNAKKEF